MRFILVLLLLTLPALGQTISYPSSGGSTTTNTTTNITQHITNSTFDTGRQGWYDQVNSDTHIAWDAGRQALWVHPDGDTANAKPSFDYFPQPSSPSQRIMFLSFDIIRTCNTPVEIRFNESECYITNLGYFVGTSRIEHVFSSNWCGVATQLQFIVAQSQTTNGVGDSEAGFYFDNFYFYTMSNELSVSQSGSSPAGSISIGKTALGVTR